MWYKESNTIVMANVVLFEVNVYLQGEKILIFVSPRK